MSGRRRLYGDLYCASGDVDDGRSQDAGRVGQVRQVADVGGRHGLGHGPCVALACVGGLRGVGVPLRASCCKRVLPNIHAPALVSARGGRALAGGSLQMRRLGSTACLYGALLD